MHTGKCDTTRSSRACALGSRISGLLLVLVLLVSLASAHGQPKSELAPPPPLDPAEGRKQGRTLVESLLKLRPTENQTQDLLFKITDANDHETQVPVKFEITVTPTNFQSTYQTTQQGAAAMKLTITHTEGQPNQYTLNRPPGAPPRNLTRNELMQPFAGSDFWIADLGLEFLHWPDQRVVRKQMRKSVFCDQLESTNPNPAAGGYSKVVSWIGANRPEELVLVHADAYDAKGKLLKQFDPRKLQKINGVYQLEEMEIRNRQAGTQTKIEFNVR